MKKITIFLLLLLILVLGLNACQASETSEEESTGEPVQELPVEPSFIQDANLPSLSPEEEVASFEALRAYLPQKEGFTWVYSGFAEYGHTLHIDQRFQRADSLQMMISGLVDDVSGEMEEELFRLSLEFTIEHGQWVQNQNAPQMMGKDFKQLVLLTYPLEEGANWSQQVQTADGESLTLYSEILSIDDEEQIRVSYTDTGSDYYEERTFAKGLGMVAFTSLYQSEESDFEIGYALYREASGYPIEIALKPWLPPVDVQMLYYGLAEYAHRATLTGIEYDERGRIYTIEGDFEYDGSGIPGDFTVQYRVDGIECSITEHVIENTRLGEAKINSKFKDLKILQLPLETGNSWNQIVDIDGQEASMTATIIETSIADSGNKQIWILYQVPAEGYHENIYFEKRRFEMGRGLVGFSSLMPGELPLEGKEWDDPAKVEQALANQQFGYGQNPM
jgi:hypothetical protein